MISKERFLKNMAGFLSGDATGFHILEDQIDFLVQKEYFEASREQKANGSDPTEGTMADDLSLIPDAGRKKQILVEWAHRGDVASFRKIERFLEAPDSGLRDWAILARNECRMILESSLLDENQVFISTGMGGQAGKLRFFIVLICRGLNPYSPIQQKILTDELQFALEKGDGVLESTRFEEELAFCHVLIPLATWPKDIIDQAIAEMNSLGDFVQSEFLITNVRAIEPKEVREFLKGAAPLNLLPPGFSFPDDGESEEEDQED